MKKEEFKQLRRLILKFERKVKNFPKAKEKNKAKLKKELLTMHKLIDSKIK